MKIRDIREFVKTQSKNQNVNILGSETEDPFLSSIYGDNADIELKVGSLINFAGKIHEQVIYEVLQNADDSGATECYIQFDSESLLIINNGSPFYSDVGSLKKLKEGQLFSILATGKNKKAGSNENIGAKGQGSKLLYGLLTDIDFDDYSESHKTEKLLRKAIIKELNGISIFSWNQWYNIEEFRSSLETEIEYGTYSDIDTPLLVKTIFSYFPVVPNEERVIHSKEERKKLFTPKELGSFISKFNDFLNNVDAVPKLTKGTMLYLPLGKGHFKKLSKSIDSRVHSEIAISLNFLNNLENVTINGKKINKKANEVSIKTLSRNEKGKEVVKVAYSSNPVSITSSHANFYQYFPVTDESYGLKFAIHSNSFEIDSGRQKITLDSNSEEGIKKDIKLFINLLEQEKSKNNNDYIKLFRSILYSPDLSEGDNKRKFIHNNVVTPLLSFIKKNIPTVDGLVNSSQQVLIKKTSLPISPRDISIDKSWLHQDFDNDLKEIGDKLSIRKSNIFDLLKKSIDERSIVNWVEGLNSDNYYLLLDEIENYSIEELDSFPIFKGTDNNIWRIDTIQNDENAFFHTKHIEGLSSILEKLNGIVIGKEVQHNSSLLESVNNSVVEKKLFEKLVNFFVDKRELIIGSDKKQIVRELKIHFEKHFNNLRNNLNFFKNINGDFCAPVNLIDNVTNYSRTGILDNYQIKDSEYCDELKGLLISRDEIWKHVNSDWSNTLLALANEKATKGFGYRIFKELNSFISWSDEAFVDEDEFESIEMILASDGTFKSRDEIYFTKSFESFDSKTLKGANNIIKKLTNIQTVDESIQSLFSNSKFYFKQDSLKTIIDHLIDSNLNFSLSEIQLLNKIKGSSGSILSHFIIRNNESGYFLVEKETNQFTYSWNDEKSNAFLENDFEQNNGRFSLLPNQLQSIFQNDSQLKLPGDELALMFIEKYQAEESLIDILKDRSKDIFEEYVSHITEILLSDSEEYNQNSFEYKLFKLALKHDYAEEIKELIEIDGIQLSDFDKEDTFYLRINDNKRIQFSLSELISEYETNSAILKSVKNQFSSDIKSSIFRAKEPKVHEVKDEILQGSIHKPIQLFFLISCLLSEHNNLNISDYDIKNKIDDSIDYSGVLQKLFENELSNFTNEYQLWDFVPSKCIFTLENELLLDSEMIPSWVMSWADSEDKLKFLYKTGVKRPDSVIVQIRKNIKTGNDYKRDLILKIENDLRSIENTLQWCVQNVVSIKLLSEVYLYLEQLVGNHIEKNNNLSYLLHLDESSTTDNILFKIKEGRNNYKSYYYTSVRVDKIQLLVKGALQEDLSVVSCSSVSRLGGKFEANGILPIILEKKVSENEIESKEWNIDYYKQWRSEQVVNNNDLFKIHLTKSDIPFQFYIVYKGVEKPVDIQNDGNIGMDSGVPFNIYIKSPSETPILSELENQKIEFFNSDKKLNLLLRLFSLSSISESQQLVLDEIQELKLSTKEVLRRIKSEEVITEEDKTILEVVKDIDVSSDELVSIIEKYKEGELSPGDGGYDLGRELNEDELSDLRKGLNELLQLSKLSKEDLKLILDNIDKILKDLKKGDDKEPIPNDFSGYFGERLIYEILIDTGLETKHVGRINHDLESGFISEYDIVTIFNGKRIELEVKTNFDSIIHKAPKFKVQDSQYAHVLNNKVSDYRIIRIGLEDIDAKDKVKNIEHKYGELDNNAQEELRILAKQLVASSKKEISNVIRSFKISYSSFNIAF